MMRSKHTVTFQSIFLAEKFLTCSLIRGTTLLYLITSQGTHKISEVVTTQFSVLVAVVLYYKFA